MEKSDYDFYRRLRERIQEWAGDRGKGYHYLEYLLLAPDFFYLLIKLMVDGRVPLKAKAKIGAIIVYYISPIDIIPETLLGPVGFADDLVLAVWTINSLMNSVEREVLLDNWPSGENLFLAMEKIIHIADQWIGKGQYLKLKGILKKIFKD